MRVRPLGAFLPPTISTTEARTEVPRLFGPMTNVCCAVKDRRSILGVAGLARGGECLGVCYECNSASHSKTLGKAMGISVRRTCRVEGCRDETRTTKTNSPRRTEKHQRKPVRLETRQIKPASRSKRDSKTSGATRPATGSGSSPPASRRKCGLRSHMGCQATGLIPA
jgi:hypothetical protein